MKFHCYCILYIYIYVCIYLYIIIGSHRDVTGKYWRNKDAFQKYND